MREGSLQVYNSSTVLTVVSSRGCNTNNVQHDFLFIIHSFQLDGGDVLLRPVDIQKVQT